MLTANDPIREAVVDVLADGIEGLDGVGEVLEGDAIEVVGLDLDADGDADALIVGVEGDDGAEVVEVFLVEEDPAPEDESAEPLEVLLVDAEASDEETDLATDDELSEEEPELIDEVMAETDYLQDTMADGAAAELEAEEDAAVEEEAGTVVEAAAEETALDEEAAPVEETEAEPVRPEDGQVLDTIDTTGDGYADVRLIDTTDDGKADTVIGDLDNDGYNDINARDTDGNTTLDAGEGLENMEHLTRGAVASDSIDMIERDNVELDSDEDGVTNLQEHDMGMDTLDADMDRDGVGDGIELDQGSDPDAYLSNQPIEDVAEHAAWEASVEADSWDAGAGYDTGYDAGAADAGYDSSYDAGATDYE